MDRETIINLMGLLHGMWNLHDPDEVAKRYATDCLVRRSGSEPWREGREAARQWAEFMLTAFPDLRMHTSHAYVDGDVGIVLADCRGTHTGPLGAVEPTGRPMHFEMVSILDFDEDHLITRETGQWGESQLIEQLGLGEARA